jgi:hypothetical protein
MPINPSIRTKLLVDKLEMWCQQKRIIDDTRSPPESVTRDQKGKCLLSHHVQLQGSGNFGNGLANPVKRLRIWMEHTKAGDLEDEASNSDISIVDSWHGIKANRTNMWNSSILALEAQSIFIMSNCRERPSHGIRTDVAPGNVGRIFKLQDTLQSRMT